MKRMFLIVLVLLIGLGLLAGCNYPAQEEESSQETAIAQTVEASIEEDISDDQPVPTATEENEPGSESDGQPTGQPTATTSGQSSTAAPTEESDQIGDDKAAFVADVTIPDYTEIETGEEITKTWRIRNSGTTTWTTDYMLEFEKGEKLGAPTQIRLPKQVNPGDLVDISIEFTVPNATGEYSSYWILKNDDNERVGVEEEGKHLTLFMVILAVEEGGDGGNGSSGGISGGAKVTGASVTVSPQNFNGSCPADLTINYNVTTSNAGKVQFNLVFNVISPSGYKFDAPPEYLVDFTGGYTVYYNYSLFSSDPVTATVRVRAVGSNEVLSDPVQFSIKCN